MEKDGILAQTIGPTGCPLRKEAFRIFDGGRKGGTAELLGKYLDNKLSLKISISLLIFYGSICSEKTVNMLNFLLFQKFKEHVKISILTLPGSRSKSHCL